MFARVVRSISRLRLRWIVVAAACLVATVALAQGAPVPAPQGFDWWALATRVAPVAVEIVATVVIPLVGAKAWDWYQSHTKSGRIERIRQLAPLAYDLIELWKKQNKSLPAGKLATALGQLALQIGRPLKPNERAVAEAEFEVRADQDKPRVAAPLASSPVMSTTGISDR